MTELNFYVYELIDPRNNLSFYVGKGMIIDCKNRKYRRITDHINLLDTSNPFKTRVIKKIISLGYKVRYKIIKEYIIEPEALELEIRLIKQYGKRIDGTGNLTNLTDGGEGMSGHIMSDKTRRLMSLRAKERTEKYGVNFKGKKHTPETKKLFSDLRKGKRMGKENHNFGKKLSLETRRKISEKQKGKTKLPKELWYKFGSPGSRNSQSKKYLFINPSGQTFEVIGNFKGFIKENKLSYDTCREYKNKGKIPEPKNLKHNRMAITRINTIGWEIKSI